MVFTGNVFFPGYEEANTAGVEADRQQLLDEYSRARDELRRLGAKVQALDEAAQLVSLLLNPQPGETVLDACAGLGGKTGHIAQLMKNEGSIVALDLYKDKLLRLETEMQRLGITIVKAIRRNLEDPVRIRKIKDSERNKYTQDHDPIDQAFYKNTFDHNVTLWSSSR